MSLGVGLATGLYGISFGALSSAAGLSLLQTQVLSLVMFSGGSQFALVGVLASGGVAGVIPAIISAWILGIRNGFYALRMNGVLAVPVTLKAIAAQLTIDESNAVSMAQENQKDSRLGFWLTGGSVFVFWNLFTFLGALLGSSVGDPSQWGLDAAAAAAFLGLLWPSLKNLRSNLIALLAVIFTLALALVVPSGIPVIIAAPLAVLTVYALAKTKLSKKLEAGEDA
ncbi:MAG: branched-chain amino acid ABC transporter permease [Actinobacteria bacterium]|nr:branched-chain amino acid ABC transporter permease [Actinomycetota bacterium]